MDEYLAALHNLDLARSQKQFAEDATVFHHGGGVLTRIDSSDEWRKVQEETYAAIKAMTAKEGRTTPPYHDVHARDLRVQMLSPEAAVATFQTPNPGFVRRYSLAFAKRNGVWKIVHMHISRRNTPK
ncbi:MAG: nuclear transport factor 2 family protein [Pirellulaceae bacterium]|nr:nuclear transport factor 2 family protein [Pirellulaceae bacterium]